MSAPDIPAPVPPPSLALRLKLRAINSIPWFLYLSVGAVVTPMLAVTEGMEPEGIDEWAFWTSLASPSR